MNEEFLPPEAMRELIWEAATDANMGAGLSISGDSGTGKTTLAESLWFDWIARGRAALWFCPHGDSAKKLRRMVMTLPKRTQEKVLYIRLADPKAVVSLRPLRVNPSGVTPFQFQSLIAARVGHTRDLLIASAGEGQLGVTGRPLLRKWSTFLLSLAAYTRLPIVDLLRVFDVRSELFPLLVELCPTLTMRVQMAELPEMRPGEREQEISSTKSRFMSLFESPITKAVLGRSDDGVLDMHQLIDEGYSLIVDCAREGMLSGDDQKTLANLYLAEFLHAVLERPENQRRDYLCCIDELPVFDLSAPLLQQLTAEIRKFRTKFVFSFQGTSRFEGRQESEFLNSILSQCRTHIYLRHSASDARFFAEELSLPTFDPLRVKHEQTSIQQLHNGFEIHELIDHSESFKRDEGLAEGETTTSTSQANWGNQTGFSESEKRELGRLQDVVSLAQKKSQSEGGSQSTALGRNRNQSKVWGWSWGRNTKQTLVPKLITRETISGTQFYSFDEWTLKFASKITSLKTGEAYLIVRGVGHRLGKLPMLTDRLELAPKSAAKKLAKYQSYLYSLPYYATPEDIDRNRERFFVSLLNEVRRAVQQSETISIAPPAPPSITAPDGKEIPMTHEEPHPIDDHKPETPRELETTEDDWAF